MGSLYKRGHTWWMKYSKNGQTFRKSTGEKVKMRAREILNKIEGEIAEGRRPFVDFSKTTYNQLVSLIKIDYELNNRKMKRLNSSLGNLKFFENYAVNEITSVSISEYIGSRITQGVANATINRELSALKRMFRLGIEQTPPLVDKIPVIKMLKENNVRTGFFEHDDFLKIRDNLPEYLQPVVTFGYYYGWRSKEILNIKWSSVDRNFWIVRLEVGTSKNNEGRTVYLNDDLKIIFQDLWKQRKKRGILLPYVFPNYKYSGKIRDFRGSWDAAFKKTGIERKLFHDLRRTAVRNMIRAGTPERVAMQISGHKTRSVFDRYNIVSENDLKQAQKDMNNFFWHSFGHN